MHTVVLALTAALAWGGDKPFKVDHAKLADTAPASCSFGNMVWPPNLKVYAVKARSGKPLATQIDKSGKIAGQIDVVVKSEYPVALMFDGYDPIIWNVGRETNTKIVAVAATGYNRQVVAGIPRSLPTVFSTRDNAGSCQSLVFDKDETKWNEVSKQLFGKVIDRSYAGSEKGAVAVGAHVGLKDRVVTSDETPAESFYLKDDELSGEMGIKAAVKAGFLRPSRESEYVAANRVIGRDDTHGMRGDAVPTDTFTVLKAFRVPAGMSHSFRVKLIVLGGVPAPSIDEDSSRSVTIVHLGDKTCSGDCASKKQIEEARANWSTGNSRSAKETRKIRDRFATAGSTSSDKNSAAKSAKEFMTKNGLVSGIKSTGSGLQYLAKSEGGGKKPKFTDKVDVEYTATLPNGQVIDSTDGRGQPGVIEINKVVSGLAEGLLLMSEGSSYKIFIPPHLGYGSADQPEVPANSVMIYEIKLIKVH